MSVVERLRGVDWEGLSVSYVVLFGSMARRPGRARDIDLGVKFTCRPSLDLVGEVLERVSEATGFAVDRIDLVILNRRDLPCTLVREVYCKGRLVYCADRDEYLDDLLYWVKLCYDYEIMARKNRVLGTALEVVKRRWGLSGSY